MLFIVALVYDGDAAAGVEEGQLAQAVGNNVEREDAFPENFGVGLEGDGGPVVFGIAVRFYVGLGLAALVVLLPVLPVAVYAHFQPLGQRVHNRDSYAVQSAGNLVSAFVELAAGVEHGQDHFHGRFAFKLGVPDFLHWVHGDPAAVIGDRADILFFQDNFYLVATAGHDLVYTVVHDFVDQVVEALQAGGTDIHSRALAHGLEAFHDLYFGRIVTASFFGVGCLVHGCKTPVFNV